MKRIAVFGICGKMGTAITKELLKENDLKVVGGLDLINTGEDFGSIAGTGKTGVMIYSDYEDINKLNADLIIDFTNAGVACKSINWAIKNSKDIIVGTTGFKNDEIEDIKNSVNKASSKVFLVPNFSIGAVIMIKISKMIANYFDDCEIIELHHDKKKDAPSGTSILTARAISENKLFSGRLSKKDLKEEIEESRGICSDGIRIHSVRLPGFLAHQEVIFGTSGQTLSIRHDSIDRFSFYPGVVLAIKSIDSLENFTYGLDKIIDL